MSLLKWVAIALLLTIVATACTSNKKQLNRIANDPNRMEPLVPETSPLIREKRNFRLPKSLLLAREDSAIIIWIDSLSLIDTLFEVGYKMTTGFESESFVVVSGKRFNLGKGFNSGNGSNLGGHIIHKHMCGIPSDSKEYTVEFAVELFEADVSAGHMWHPMSPKYKILWIDTLRCAGI